MTLKPAEYRRRRHCEPTDPASQGRQDSRQQLPPDNPPETHGLPGPPGRRRCWRLSLLAPVRLLGRPSRLARPEQFGTVSGDRAATQTVDDSGIGWCPIPALPPVGTCGTVCGGPGRTGLGSVVFVLAPPAPLAPPRDILFRGWPAGCARQPATSRGLVVVDSAWVSRWCGSCGGQRPGAWRPGCLPVEATGEVALSVIVVLGLQRDPCSGGGPLAAAGNRLNTAPTHRSTTVFPVGFGIWMTLVMVGARLPHLVAWLGRHRAASAAGAFGVLLDHRAGAGLRAGRPGDPGHHHPGRESFSVQQRRIRPRHRGRRRRTRRSLDHSWRGSPGAWQTFRGPGLNCSSARGDPGRR